MNRQRVMQSEYMYWAKTSSGAKYNLASSDLLHLPLSDLKFRLPDLSITGASGYGYPPLLEAIARKENVTTNCVVEAVGTAMANHIAIAALIEPGDEVLIEHPTYELIPSTAQYLGANVRRFHRRFENKFLIDPDELRRAVTPRTRLIILTNLHNPSSAFTDVQTLKQVGELAASIGAKVLVDEVYLRAAFSKKLRSAFHLGNHFITTNSLTKVYGLSGLRCGWILAEESLAQKMWRLIDLHYSSYVHIGEQLSTAAFEQLDIFTQRAESLLKTNIELLNSFFQSRKDISAIRHEHGLIAFPKIHSGNAERLCDLLRNSYETAIVPGRFFDMREHVRIGIGKESQTVRQGLANVASALDEIAGAR